MTEIDLDNIPVEREIELAMQRKAKAGNVDAAKYLASQREKTVRPIKFAECVTLDQLETAFAEYMAQDNLTTVEAESASKAFDRLFKAVVARDKAHRDAMAEGFGQSGLMIVPFSVSVEEWGKVAETTQADLKKYARS